MQYELYRAVRLVLDTGLHAKRWSFGQAVDYMVDNTGFSPGESQDQVARYLAMPGQATAYKIGMLDILRLRDLAEQALGEEFDLREFHRVILSAGSVPLEILDRIVEDYIAKKTNQGGRFE
jgi:uncharacterized protein (DUF885 family)